MSQQDFEERADSAKDLIDDLLSEIETLREEVDGLETDVDKANDEVTELQTALRSIPDEARYFRSWVEGDGIAPGVREGLELALEHCVTRFGLASGEAKAVQCLIDMI